MVNLVVGQTPLDVFAKPTAIPDYAGESTGRP